MAGSFTSIHQCEKYLLIPGIDAIYRTRPARARWGKSDRSVTFPGESLLGGVTPAGTCPGSHWGVRRRATARRSPYNCFSLGWIVKSGQMMMIDQKSLLPLLITFDFIYLPVAIFPGVLHS